MPIFKKSELFPFLEGLGIAPKKALSQNFLIDGNILDKIVQVSNVQEGDSVLEIGPGPGALTEKLLEKKAAVTAVEKDRVLAEALKRFEGKLSVFNEDIMDFDLQKLPKNSKVIANLPYHLTTPILSRLIQEREIFSSITVMVQDEVAKRMVAKSRTPDYGSLSLYLSYYTEPVYGFKVTRRCFYPAPAVDSAVVHLKLITPPACSDEKSFFEMTRASFGQRRKMLRASLSSLYDKDLILKSLGEMHLEQSARPEELSRDQFLQLFELLRKNSL